MPISRIVPALIALCAVAARADEIDYKKLYSAVSPAVVLVYGEHGQTGSIGTGSIIAKMGLVVTNAHVILDHEKKQPFEKLFVFLKPDKITGQVDQDLRRGYKARWLSYDPSLDLALLQMLDAPADLPVVGLSDDDVAVGEATAAIGHPEHGARWSLTTGRIGGEFADFEGVKGKDVYQMETSVNRGNSGGPLLDGNGHMVGINTSIARRSEDGLAITGVNFALKSSVVRKYLAQTAAAFEKKGAGEEKAAPPPPPQAVAKAEPAPAPEEHKPAQGDAPVKPAEQVAPTTAASDAAPPQPVAKAVPPAPPEGKRGYTSSEPPGKVMSPMEAVRWRAQKAFDELDAESARHPGKKAGH